MVVATHARSGASRWLYGQVTEFLLPRANVPVLLIPEAATARWPEDRGLKILVGLDGSSSAEAIVEPVANLARCLDAEVVLVEVVDPAVGGRLVDDPARQLALSFRSCSSDPKRRRLAGGFLVRACPLNGQMHLMRA